MAPRIEFIKADEAEFSCILSAQQASVVGTCINALSNLQQGEGTVTKKPSRWQAGYDLAMGRTLAIKVRTETYNARS
jgi:hypothetical protein